MEREGGTVGDITNGDGEQGPKVDSTNDGDYSEEDAEEIPLQVGNAGIKICVFLTLRFGKFDPAL